MTTQTIFSTDFQHRTQAAHAYIAWAVFWR
nr:MAG TPA: hypothetical protein [Caudoviricetes sp.]